jgi:hypothetical protein
MNDYIIISEISSTNLRKFVNSYLDVGYKCQGGVTSCALPSGRVEYSQALLRTE